jgi:hypothetical protein
MARSVLRRQVAVAFLAALLPAALPSAPAARVSRPKIKGDEVGYFGSAAVTHRISVFVYSNLGPSDGTVVTVCIAGRCKRARGHSRPAPWYSASFTTRGLRMGDPVRFTVLASDSAGHSKVTVTKDLLCMHNDGSTPQS